MGGTEVFTRNLLRELARVGDPRFAFVACYAQPRQRDTAPNLLETESDYLPEIVLNRVRSGSSRFDKFKLWMATAVRSRSIWNEIERKVGGNIDIALFPFTAIQPIPRRRMSTVPVIHDLQHRELRSAFSLGQKLYRWLTYERPVRAARAVIAVSDFTRDTVVRFLDARPEKVHRIYPGLDPSFFANVDSIREKNAFLYYPARALPHKNHRRLFDAVALLRTEFPNLQLVLSGLDKHLLGELPEFVTHVGHVSLDETQRLYRECSAVVFPSLYEGFGFPALEALALGAPLVVAETGSLPEIVKSDAFLVDPLSVESIAAGIRAALGQDASSESARQRAQQFTWQATVEQTLELLNTIGHTSSVRS